MAQFCRRDGFAVPDARRDRTRRTWQTAIADLGFPSRKDKTVVADLRGLFPTDDRRVRIRTNLMVYWDETFFTTGPAEPTANDARVTVAGANHADLHYRGFSREYRRGRHGPHWFDYEDVTTAPKWHDLAGSYTAFGDVTELVGEGDDRYVIANVGDEITIRFDVDAFPEVADGWRRTFLICSDGWVKDGDLNTASGDRVGPFLHRGQSAYPLQQVRYSADPERAAALELQTRRVEPPAGSPTVPDAR